MYCNGSMAVSTASFQRLIATISGFRFHFSFRFSFPFPSFPFACEVLIFLKHTVSNNMTIIGASLSEPHINGYFNVRSIYNITMYILGTLLKHQWDEPSLNE